MTGDRIVHAARGMAHAAGRLGVAGLALALGLGSAAAETLTLKPTVLPDRKAVLGQVESADTTLARARIAGTVTALAIDEGDKVQAGDIVARIVDPKLELQVAAVESRIEAARAEAHLAEIELDRTRTLRQRGTVSESVLDAAQTQLGVARGNLAALRAEREVVRQRRAEGEVLAPETGRVLDVHVTDNQVIQPGEAIATIACECYVLRLRLPERHARFIAEGDEVLVGARGLAIGNEKLRRGRIRQVYPQLEDGRVVADVAVDGLGDYFVGERTRVYVATDRRTTYLVPPGYLFTRAGVANLWVRDVGPVVVQPGRELAEGVEILTGVSAGDVLVMPGTDEAAGIADRNAQ